MLLTDQNTRAILIPLSKKTKVGISTPFGRGENSPQSLAAFLCPVISTAFVRVYSVMAGLFGQPSRLAAPLRGSTNPLNPVARRLVPMGGGYFLLEEESSL